MIEGAKRLIQFSIENWYKKDQKIKLKNVVAEIYDDFHSLEVNYSISHTDMNNWDRTEFKNRVIAMVFEEDFIKCLCDWLIKKYGLIYKDMKIWYKYKIWTWDIFEPKHQSEIIHQFAFPCSFEDYIIKEMSRMIVRWHIDSLINHLLI